MTRAIVGKARDWRAADAYAALYELMRLKRVADAAWQTVSVIVTPTAGSHYTIAELEADPIRLNSNLGYYTNFVNLMDLSALAIPAGFANGLPYGATLVGRGFHEPLLASYAAALQQAVGLPLGATRQPLPPPAFAGRAARERDG